MTAEPADTAAQPPSGPPDRLADLAGDVLDALAVSIDRERDDGRHPRTALEVLRVIADTRPELLRPPPPPAEPEPPRVLSTLDQTIAQLDESERAGPMISRPGARRRR